MGTETAYESDQMSDLTNNDFKVATRRMFKEHVNTEKTSGLHFCGREITR